ncbi:MULTISPECIES: hypothetical protein [unclassified Acinetobacter]
MGVPAAMLPLVIALELGGGYFALMLLGAGAWSIDALLEKNK